MLAKVKKYIKSLKTIISFKCLLATGFYLIDPKQKSFEQVNFMKWMKTLFFKKIHAFIIGGGIIKAGSYAFGTSKSVLLVENGAYIKYFSEERMANFCIRYNIVNLLPYKYSKMLSFDYKKRMIYEERASGTNPCNTLESTVRLLDLYVKNYNETTVQIKQKSDGFDIVYLFQHGDFGHNNIFINLDSLTVVDLDSVNLFPFFYDVFYFLFLRCDWDISKRLFDSGIVYSYFLKLCEKCNYISNIDIYTIYLIEFVKNVTSEKCFFNTFVFAKTIKQKLSQLKNISLYKDAINFIDIFLKENHQK